MVIVGSREERRLTWRDGTASSVRQGGVLDAEGRELGRRGSKADSSQGAENIDEGEGVGGHAGVADRLTGSANRAPLAQDKPCLPRTHDTGGQMTALSLF